MNSRDIDILKHIISYCDEVVGIKLKNVIKWQLTTAKSI